MPADSSRYYRHGSTERADIAAAIAYVRAQGAEKAALLGSWMGGAITASFLREASLTDAVDAVVLDAPILDSGPPSIIKPAVSRLPVWPFLEPL